MSHSQSRIRGSWYRRHDPPSGDPSPLTGSMRRQDTDFQKNTRYRVGAELASLHGVPKRHHIVLRDMFSSLLDLINSLSCTHNDAFSGGTAEVATGVNVQYLIYSRRLCAVRSNSLLSRPPSGLVLWKRSGALHSEHRRCQQSEQTR